MLVKPRPKEEPKKAEIKVEKTEKPKKTSKKKCVCNKCHKEVSYIEVSVPISYGLNCKKKVEIEGIERQCSICGWHVDDIEVDNINREIALKVI